MMDGDKRTDSGERVHELKLTRQGTGGGSGVLGRSKDQKQVRTGKAVHLLDRCYRMLLLSLFSLITCSGIQILRAHGDQ